MAKDARVEGKKAEILDWALERFYEGGFHATGIDCVMAGSGISKRTVYKYFASKEALIEAVLEHYGAGSAGEFFSQVMAASDDPRQQIMACFDIRKAMIDEDPGRGCLGIKASQEYIGKHAGIAAHGENAARHVERLFVEICERAGFVRPEELGRQIHVLFQGALLLSQVFGDGSPFVSAKQAVMALLDNAEVAVPRRVGGKKEFRV